MKYFLQSCFLLVLVISLVSCGGSTGSSSRSVSSMSMSLHASSIVSSSSSLASSSSSQSEHLAIMGKNIIGPDGNAMVLRGWNWGRWGLVQPNDAVDNAAQGANVVRIPLRWWGYYASGANIDSRDDSQTKTAGIDATNLAILDTAMDQASAAHLWIILFIDSDCGQNGAQDADEVAYCDPDKQYPLGHNFWSDPDAREKFINVWKFIAARYRNHPYLGFFEILPEPDPQNASDMEITHFYQQVAMAIREVAPGVPLLIGPRAYQMKRVDKAYDPHLQDVIYTANLFLHTGGATEQDNIDDLSARLRDLEDLGEHYQVPIFVQQAGVMSGDDPQFHYLDALLKLLTDKQIGFTYWTYRDTFNPYAYGVIYQNGTGGWETKTESLTRITASFNKSN